VLLKGRPLSFTVDGVISSALTLLYNLSAASDLLLLVVASLVVVLRSPVRTLSYATSFALLFVGTVIMHVQFARLGSLYRYDAYLICLGIIAAAVGLGRAIGNTAPRSEPRLPYAAFYAGVVVTTLVAAAPLIQRAWASARMTPKAAQNIYEQQYQMGLFLRRYYEGKTIAVNDIGAVSYWRMSMSWISRDSERLTRPV
jgi:hypothetical protein